MKDSDCNSFKGSYKQNESNIIQSVKIVDISITSDAIVTLNVKTEIDYTIEDFQLKTDNSSFDIKLSEESIFTVSNAEIEKKLNPIKGSANIGEVLALSKEVLETEVKEEADINIIHSSSFKLYFLYIRYYLTHLYYLF